LIDACASVGAIDVKEQSTQETTMRRVMINSLPTDGGDERSSRRHDCFVSAW
jgi:hypothetical protein